MRLIDADALDESFRESISKCKEWMKNADEEMKPRAEQAMVTFMECSMRLKKEPTVETTNVAERKKSKWLPFREECHDMFKCSDCGNITRVPFKCFSPPYYYCPYCGAEMEKTDG